MAEPTSRRKWLVRGAYVAVWFFVALAATVLLFLNSSREVTVASHDAIVSPELGDSVVLRTGPVLPDFRIDSPLPIGLDIQLGKTQAPTTEALVERYALIGSQPEGAQAKIEDAVSVMAVDALVRGAALGLVPIGLFIGLGRARRRELLLGLGHPRGLLALVVVVSLVVASWSPWRGEELRADQGEWIPLQEFLGESVEVPEQAAGVEVLGDGTTYGTRRLIDSAIDTYERSQTFYAAAVEAAADLELREPEEGETVVALVSDRHDNIGMDPVARAVADVAGATAVFDAGDDTSSGKAWEAFSLDSVTAAFSDFDERFSVAGNHDNGTFVTNYMAADGWEVLDGEVVDGPGGSRLLGVNDPRSSGLGTWRDATGLSFGEVGDLLADAACAADEADDRVNTVLVHDANLGKEALERGCVDLVVGGHLHVQVGPTPVIGPERQIGYSLTTGTTGGAAYALAIGSKLRRTAQIMMLTYAEDGTPAGIQSVLLQTNGNFRVEPYVPLVF